MAEAAVYSAIVAAASLGHQVESSNQQRRLAGQAADRQQSAMDQQEKALAEKKRQEEITAQRNKELQRQKSLAAGAQGRNSTILTSDLGVPGGAGATGGNKTLLGT